MKSVDTVENYPARGAHRLAVLVVCLVWPLIWVGGLVTTYDAGMAVPDWPGTYGYNLFLYPYETWLLGPFDLFIEHGHRLLGAVVGFVSIGLVIASLRFEPRTWAKWTAVAVLVAVIGQGVLGGMRVVLGDRTLAMVHGCTGPVFFALCVAAAATTGQWWWSRGRPNGAGGVSAGTESGQSKVTPTHGLAIGACCVVVLSYVQLVYGAQLRHVQPTETASGFAMTVSIHVLLAFVLWCLIGFQWIRVRACGDLTLSRPAVLLLGFVSLQIVLGVATWVVNYGFPTFLQAFPGSEGFLVRSKGFLDSIVVTAHVATGSLILAQSVMILIRILRLRHIEPAT